MCTDKFYKKCVSTSVCIENKLILDKCKAIKIFRLWISLLSSYLTEAPAQPIRKATSHAFQPPKKKTIKGMIITIVKFSQRINSFKSARHSLNHSQEKSSGSWQILHWGFWHIRRGCCLYF